MYQYAWANLILQKVGIGGKHFRKLIQPVICVLFVLCIIVLLKKDMGVTISKYNIILKDE